MEFVLYEILKGHLVIILILLISYVIEMRSQLKLFIKAFRIPKNHNMARGAAVFHAILYFLVCLGIVLFDHFKIQELPEGYAFWKWLLIMIPLTIIFRMAYYRLTPKDPDRDDYDFSE